MIIDKVSKGAKEKFAINEGQEVADDKLNEIRKDDNFLVTETDGKVVIKEKLIEKTEKDN